MNLFFWRKPERDTGRRGESLAARFLEKQGYRILRRNWRNRFGEIDLIARHGDEVVFVEVKTRATGAWGDPSEAVDRHKRRKLRLAAESFASRARIRNHPLRFDVISIVLNDSDKPEIHHYQNAFRMDGD